MAPEVMGSYPLRCPSRGGRLENRLRHQRLLDWRGNANPGGVQDVRMLSRSVLPVRGVSERGKDHGGCGSLFPLRVARETYTGFSLHVSLRNLMRRGGFG